MKYMILIYGEQDSWKELATWSKEDIGAMVGFMESVNKDLADAGELIEAQGLADPEQSKTVRAKSDGSHTVTDGPYSKAKEVLAGYWVVDVKSPERAIEIAARVSASPGQGGVPSNDPIEVRPIGEAPA